MRREPLTQPGEVEMDSKLQAYYDGELSRLGRWWIERRLAASAELRRELAALTRLSELVRESEAPVEDPDLWPAIAGQVSREAPGGGPIRAVGDAGSPRFPWLAPLLRPAGALAVAAAAALALVRGDAWWGGEVRPERSGGVVRWIDSGSRSVLVFEDEAGGGATLVWVLDSEPQSGRPDPQGAG